MTGIYKYLCILTFFLMKLCSGSRVLELSDKFSEVRREGGYWLVMFYAPWCGHCRRLDPVWNHVAQALYKTNIRVGRVDCTRFSALATEFSIPGYPTIKFIKQDGEYTFNGDRNKDELVNFAVRLAGPSVQEVTRAESIENIKAMNQLFFMYIGEQEGPLWESYRSTATKMQMHGYFYSANTEIAKQHVDIDELPAVFVYKESHYYFYHVDPENEYLNTSMHDWINEERFETFPKITRGNINEVIQTKKYLVLAVVEENKLQQIPVEMLEFRDMVESVIRSNRNKYHKNFQFGWVGSPDIANTIAMTVLPLPYLLVLNSTTSHHHMPEDEPTQLTPDALELFLERIYNQSVPAYGGNSLSVTFYRSYFEARMSLADMWRGNPVLTTVLFGLPLGFLSLIIYSACCSDILDAEEEEDHEKRD